MHHTPHDAISFHLAKLLSQHLFRHSRYRTTQLGESPHVATKEMKQNH